MRLRLTLALALAAGAMQAATLVNVRGSGAFGFTGTVTAAGFSLSTTCTGVTVAAAMADLTNGGPIVGTEGTVYLVNQIGASATAANNVAPPVTITGLAATFAVQTLFTGLTLGPGSYYLVWVPTTSGIYPSMTPGGVHAPGDTFSAGVTDLGSTQFSGTVAGFPPASNITGFSTPDNFLITVTGTEPQAANLVNVTGSGAFGFTGAITAAGFTLSTTYTGVSITAEMADLTNGGPISTAEGTVYLVNQIGAVATAANNVAPPVTIQGLTATFTPRTLFEGLTLGAGTYYLVWVPTNSGIYPSMTPGGVHTPGDTYGTGVTDLGSTQFGGTPAAFPPASNITGFSTPDNFLIAVSGIQSSPATPAPPTIFLLLAALACLTVWYTVANRKRAAAGRV